MILFEATSFYLGVELPVFRVDTGTGGIKEPAHQECKVGGDG